MVPGGSVYSSIRNHSPTCCFKESSGEREGLGTGHSSTSFMSMQLKLPSSKRRVVLKLFAAAVNVAASTHSYNERSVRDTSADASNV